MFFLFESRHSPFAKYPKLFLPELKVNWRYRPSIILATVWNRAMSYSKHLPTNLRYWLRDWVPDQDNLVISIPHRGKTHTLRVPNRTLPAREMFITLFLCDIDYTVQGTDTYWVTVRVSLRNAILSGHITLAKWIMCRHRINPEYEIEHALWIEKPKFMAYFPYVGWSKSAEQTRKILKLVPTLFALSFLVKNLGYDPEVRRSLASGMFVYIVDNQYWDLLCPLITHVSVVNPCRLCDWGIQRRGIMRCVHGGPPFRLWRDTIEKIPTDILQYLRNTYPWFEENTS